eukprot:TRINITY_DN1961_c0_g2_i2.p1 TRINITY_DN1961_c0_g2~~TRINITY_DN1961_c0_g2_i2.p1  ORF type:complete len:158 (+),score=20.90 TRINITY_DN1961_c0_g2_i2:57-530(+)
MSGRFGGSPKCPGCQKSVYHNEQVMALDKPWHARCLKCAQCAKVLDPGSLNDRQGKVYCAHCYGAVAGLRGYGYGAINESHVSGGAAGVDHMVNSEVLTDQCIEGGLSGKANYSTLERQPSSPTVPASSTPSSVNFCSNCGEKASGNFCSSCGTRLS